jgi:hypothetical protein
MADWREFASFIKQIRAAANALGMRPYQDTFYRGHRSASYKLLPSLFRQAHHSYDQYLQLERRMFFEFRTRARQLYDNEHTGWDVLFHMQHHGVPTRLLDWSSVFGVALYFALLDYTDEAESTPSIWILNPYALNLAGPWKIPRLFDPKYLARDERINRSYDYDELLLGDHPQNWGNDKLWETPLAIYTSQRSERMFAQGGFFTIHGLDNRPLEEIFADGSGIYRKVEVPRSAIPSAKEFLSLAGIGHRQLFPDLDGIARSIKDKFNVTR